MKNTTTDTNAEMYRLCSSESHYIRICACRAIIWKASRILVAALTTSCSGSAPRDVHCAITTALFEPAKSIVIHFRYSSLLRVYEGRGCGKAADQWCGRGWNFSCRRGASSAMSTLNSHLYPKPWMTIPKTHCRSIVRFESALAWELKIFQANHVLVRWLLQMPSWSYITDGNSTGTWTMCTHQQA